MRKSRLDGKERMEKASAAVHEKFGEDVETDMQDLYMVMQDVETTMPRIATDVAAAYILACARNNINYQDMRKFALETRIASIEPLGKRAYLLRRANIIVPEKMSRPIGTNGHKKCGRKNVLYKFNQDVFMTTFNATVVQEEQQ